MWIIYDTDQAEKASSLEITSSTVSLIWQSADIGELDIRYDATWSDKEEEEQTRIGGKKKVSASFTSWHLKHNQKIVPRMESWEHWQHFSQFSLEKCGADIWWTSITIAENKQNNKNRWSTSLKGYIIIDIVTLQITRLDAVKITAYTNRIYQYKKPHCVA